MTLRKDPRLDPRIFANLEAFGALDEPPPSPVNADSTREELLAFGTAMEEGVSGFLEAKYAAMAPIPKVTYRTEMLTGVDGNEIKLSLFAPADLEPNSSSQKVPCIFQIHGGGMMMGCSTTPNFFRWCAILASRGVVVVGTDFRNTAGVLGPHPFPAGLNDCMSSLLWTHAHRDELGISTIVLQGDSSGANLCLALALKAKKEGEINAIQGIYSMCPMIYGDWANAASNNPELLSIRENSIYMPGTANLSCLNAKLYTPNASDLRNPLAWPFHATLDELAGLPPSVISVNELDPLRDEGLAMYRKLAAAGNDAAARVVAGTTHGEDMNEELGGIHKQTVRDIIAFALEL